MATTGFCDSAKVELMQAGHCFNGTVITNATSGNATFTLTGIASTAGLAVGMAVSGANITAGAVIASVDSATQVTMSKASGASPGTNSTTFTGDVLKILLIKVAPTRTFDHTQTNVGTPGVGSPSTSNVGTDETSGTGYTSGGTALGNVTPSLSSTTAVTNFSPNPSWTGSSFSTTAGIIYNSSQRLGAAAAPLSGRTISVHDYGGTQTVSSGTFTAVMPVAAPGTAIIQIS